MTVEEKVLAVTSDGLALACSYVSGESPRGMVVLLHGIPSVEPPAPDDTGYRGFAGEMAEAGWLAVWADLRAVRDSPGYFTIEGWVRDAAAVVEAARAIGLARDLPVALVGSSAGGAVSAEVVRRGGAVDALALLAAPAGWMFFTTDAHEGLRRITEEAGMTLAPEVLADPTSWAAEFDSVSTQVSVTGIEIPILIVHGTADDVVPVEHARLIAAGAPSAELVLLEGSDHFLRKDPRAKQVLREWLDKTLS